MYNIWLAIVVLCVIIILCFNKCVFTSVALYCMGVDKREGGLPPSPPQFLATIKKYDVE